MGRTARFAALAFSLLVPMAPAGCSRIVGCAPRPPADITESDLAGVYTGVDGERIELGKDGRYRASNLPGASEEGTWALDLDSASTEDLMLEDFQLWISGNRAEPWLYRFDGDPDNCDLIRFQRAG
jgi:hypothetical protein